MSDSEQNLDSKHHYTLIAHKPESADYCRNCLMADYPGDFKYWTYLDQSELVIHWISVLMTETRINEAGYSIMVFMDGDWIGGDTYPEMDGSMYPEYDTPENLFLENKMQVYCNLEKGVKVEVEKRKAEKQKALMDAAALKRELERSQKENYERQQLAALKAKYEREG